MKIENQISFDIRGCIFEVFNRLGPGLFESVYENALKFELNEKGYSVLNQVGIPVYYKDVDMDLGFRCDLMVANRVIIEIKSIENLSNIHFKQVLTYLKLSDLKLGILVNFNSNEIDKNIHRIVNKL